MTLQFLIFFTGLALLYFGADFLVNGSSRLALSYGIRPLVIGMTVVAFATSMPEMLVSLMASFQNSSDLAVGNIIGSNIANIGFILATAALITPLTIERTTVLREFPIMIGASVLLTVVSLDTRLSRADGLMLFSGLIIFILYCVRSGRDNSNDTPVEPGIIRMERAHRTRDYLFITGGIAGLAGGAELMVSSASTIARSMGISELVIGITIVAVGTSLPELAATILSASKGEMDISVGNVIGSNIFNILFVLGICPMVRPLPLPETALTVEFPVMLLFAVIPFLMIFRVHQLRRVHGLILLAGYLLFVWSRFR